MTEKKEIIRRIIGNTKHNQHTINLPKGTFKRGDLLKIVKIGKGELTVELKNETYEWLDSESRTQSDKRINTPGKYAAKILEEFVSNEVLKIIDAKTPQENIKIE